MRKMGLTQHIISQSRHNSGEPSSPASPLFFPGLHPMRRQKRFHNKRAI